MSGELMVGLQIHKWNLPLYSNPPLADHLLWKLKADTYVSMAHPWICLLKSFITKQNQWKSKGHRSFDDHDPGKHKIQRRKPHKHKPSWQELCYLNLSSSRKKRPQWYKCLLIRSWMNAFLGITEVEEGEGMDPWEDIAYIELFYHNTFW